MMMLWACAGVPLGVYNIVQDFNVALRIQPQILTLLSLVTWIQCYYYERVNLHRASCNRLWISKSLTRRYRNGPSPAPSLLSSPWQP